MDLQPGEFDYSLLDDGEFEGPTELTDFDEPIHIEPVRYELKSAIHTARYSFFERTGALVRLRDEDGVVGFGEALPLPSWPDGDPERVIISLTEWAEQMSSAPPHKVVDIDSAVPKHPVAAFAVDTARYSILGQRTDRSVAQILAGDAIPTRFINANALVSDPAPEVAAEQARAAQRDGFAAVKLKVAADHISVDMARVAAVRDAVGPEFPIRLDANQGWTAAEMAENLEVLAAYDIEYIEEPTASLSAINKLRFEGSPIPIYLDEHLSSSRDTHQVIISGYADGLVLKPAVLGRLGVTKELAEQALRVGINVTVTNSLDSGIGATAAVHAAASIVGLENACGFGTGDLFANSAEPPPRVTNGRVPVRGPGFDLRPSPLTDILAPDLAERSERKRAELKRPRRTKRG